MSTENANPEEPRHPDWDQPWNAAVNVKPSINFAKKLVHPHVERDDVPPAEDHVKLGYEPDPLPFHFLLIALVVMGFIVGGSGIAMVLLHHATATYTLKAKEAAPVYLLTPMNPETAREVLGSYQRFDDRAGRYRIPVDEAMRRLAADPSLIAPIPLTNEEIAKLPPPSAAPTPAVTPAGADAGAAIPVPVPGATAPAEGESAE
ncbi:hypothetical protein K8I61_14595 [bacterium]|nr:hypothetical protein [bacterium]